MIREDMKYDMRTQKYRIRRNEISREELEKHLASLPDEAAEAEAVVTPFVATFEDRKYRD